MELIPLREAFFNPDLVRAQGIDRFLRGAAFHPAKEIDLKVRLLRYSCHHSMILPKVVFILKQQQNPSRTA